MIFRRSGLITFPLAFAVLAAAGGVHVARAQATHEYEIASDDGYGLQDCLAAGSQCGQVVADAWCEAHGQSRALAFGPKSAGEERATKVSASSEPYVIKCAE